MHGPLELVEAGFPVLVYAQDDVARPATEAAVARLKSMGMDASTMSTAQVADFQKAEVAKWAAVIKEANVKVDG